MAAGDLVQPPPHAGFGAYLCSRCGYSGILFLWAFVANALCNSILTANLPQLSSFPDLIEPTAYIYFAFAMLLLALGTLNVLAYRDSRLYVDKYVGFILLYLGTAAFALFMNRAQIVNKEPIHAIRSLLQPVLIGFFFIQTLKRRHVRTVGRVFVAFALINVVISFHEMYFAGGDLTFTHTSAIFGDRNLFARFLSITHGFLLIDFLARKKKTLLCFDVAAMLLILVCVTLLLSRSGYGMYLFVNMYILMQGESRVVRRVIPVFLVVVVLLFGFMFAVRVRTERMNIRPSSDIGRIGVMLAGFNMIKASPVYGVGYGMASLRYVEFQDKQFPGLRDLSSIHNIYVNVMAEQGILGLCAYMLLNLSLLAALRRAMKGRRFPDKTAEMFCFVSVVTHLLHGIVYHSVDYEGVYWILIVLSIICLRDATEKGHAQETTSS